jgi:speckle-type POZ protein
MFAPILADEMNIEYRLIVYPGGFHAESADFIAVFIFAGARGETFKYMPEGTCTISFEILDETGHRTVFDNHTAASEQTLELQNSCKGYVRFVKRREMEASSCVRRHDDSFVIRCTVSFLKEVTKRPSKVFLADQAPSPPKPEEARTTTGSHVFTIDCFSEVKAALRSGECAHSAQFRLGGSSWYIKVYPNGHSDFSRGYVSVFLGRGRSDERGTTAEFGFEIVGLTEVGKVEFRKHTFDGADPEDGFPFLATCSDVASIQNKIDRLAVRCLLRVMNVGTTPSWLPAALPPTVVSSTKNN